MALSNPLLGGSIKRYKNNVFQSDFSADLELPLYGLEY